MPKIFAVNEDALGAMHAEFVKMAGTDATALAAVEANFAELAKGASPIEAEEEGNPFAELVDKSAGGDIEQSPVADVLREMYEAVDTVSKAKAGDKSAAFTEIFEKGFAAIAEIEAEQMQLAEVAGIEKARGKKVVAPAEGGDAPGAGGQGGHAFHFNFGKAAKKPEAEDEDEDCEGMDDVEKRIAKSMTGPAGAIVRAIIRKNHELEAAVGKIEKRERTAHFAKMAADAGEGAEFAAVLEKLAVADPKSAETIAKTVGDKNKLIRKGGLFGEIGGGSPGAAGSDAYSQLSAKATEIMKSDTTKKTTFAKAFTQACEQEPELYREHNNEQRARARS
jgi:hypothetical protein